MKVRLRTEIAQADWTPDVERDVRRRQALQYVDEFNGQGEPALVRVVTPRKVVCLMYGADTEWELQLAYNEIEGFA